MGVGSGDLQDPRKKKQHYNRQYREQNREKVAKLRWIHQLRSVYGITLEDYEKLVEEHQGLCAICGDLKGLGLFIDHDHDTGKVRGLLCNRCNAGIGFLGDSLQIAQRAVAYLRKHGVKR